MLQKADEYPWVKDYLPIKEDQYKLPRAFVAVLCATLIGEPFKHWVKEAVEKRNEEFADKNQCMIEVEKSIAD